MSNKNRNIHRAAGFTRTGTSPGSVTLSPKSPTSAQNNLPTVAVAMASHGPRVLKCPALATCPNLIPISVVFCIRHWAMLPPYLQRTLASFKSLDQTADLKYRGALEEAVGAIAWEEKQRAEQRLRVGW